jgi:hypothetical protein
MSDLGRDGPGDPGLRGTLTGLFGAPAQTAPPKWQQTRREEFSRLLGGTVSGGIANPLGGSLDPVNVMPDLTRQEINPVMGRVSSPLANPAQATFSDSLRSVSGPALGRGRGLDLGLPQGFAPASGLNPLAPALEPRRPAASPLVLDIPRRRF